MVIEDRLACLADAFGWGEGAAASPGPRGALGQIWRIDVGGRRYALKEILFEPRSEALIAAELGFARQASAAGVRLPASHPDRAGQYLHTAPDGAWFRLYDWVDLKPVDLTAPTTPAELGALFARLHRCAPVERSEVDGSPAHPWYDRAPADPSDWVDVAAADAVWASRLADRLAMLPALAAVVRPVDPDALILCHRDLHPENVLADPDGGLVVVDWDNLGPAEPGREIAQALFDWFHDGSTDADAVRAMYGAYVREGGPGRIGGLADFSSLLAVRLNFLLRQAGIAIDPAVAPRDREWAEREIDESLRILPRPEDLTRMLELTRAIT